VRMEHASGPEEDITIPTGHLRQPRSWSALCFEHLNSEAKVEQSTFLRPARYAAALRNVVCCVQSIYFNERLLPPTLSSPFATEADRETSLLLGR